ncbi:MAG: hypothetical protein IJB12_00415 [Methanocorpusculum sp.]|nr:hypothetical protein [Methanocorpusculum sp.]MBQ9831117.1 hypothetical protein [Methanocorpusculum sp.]
MDYLTILIGFAVICFFVVILTGFLESRLKKNKEQPAAEEPAEPQPDFTVGRIYQMEDGSFAKYAGNGKFLKVKK